MKKNNFNINSSTAILGIIGYPLKVTFSPVMQNAALQNLKLNYVYLPFPLEEKNLKLFFQFVRNFNINGLNVTVPYKEKCMQYLDEITDEAKVIGAVNTVVKEKNKLIGRNTDYWGFSAPLKKLKINLKNKEVLLFGAGGAAKAVLYALSLEKVKVVYITNEPVSMAVNLAKNKNYKVNCEVLKLSDKKISAILQKVFLIINATPLGMYPDINNSIVKEFPKRKDNFIAYDLVYKPLKTKFLNLAEKSGAKIITGEKMLIYQGYKSFYLWTKKYPSFEVMKKSLSFIYE